MPTGYIKRKGGTPVEIVDAQARAAMHQHTNKAVLDGISASQMSRVDTLTDEYINGLIDAKITPLETLADEILEVL